MLIVNPKRVTFAGESWEDVRTVIVDRRAVREVVEFGDEGPEVVLADAPERRVDVRVVMGLARGDLGGAAPGDQGELRFETSVTGSDAGRRVVRATCVVLGVTHEVSDKNGAVRTVKLIAVSGDGSSDPLVFDEPGGGS